jgi:hypothetical protein
MNRAAMKNTLGMLMTMRIGLLNNTSNTATAAARSVYHPQPGDRMTAGLKSKISSGRTRT